MEKTDWKEKILETLRSMVEPGTLLEEKTILKNNGEQVETLGIRKPDAEAYLSVYMDSCIELFEKGIPVEEVCARILEQINITAEDMEAIRCIQPEKYETVKDRIFPKLISREWNQDFLKTVPHIPFLDLEIVFYIHFPDVMNTAGSVLINNQLLKLWDISPEELQELAVQNAQKMLPAVILDANEILPIPEENLFYDMSIYVLSNEIGVYGASSCLYPNVLNICAQQLHGDFYVLPSSIHELILLPCTKDVSESGTKEHIREINQTVLSPEDRLSDNLYRYRTSTGELEIV